MSKTKSGDEAKKEKSREEERKHREKVQHEELSLAIEPPHSDTSHLPSRNLSSSIINAYMTRQEGGDLIQNVYRWLFEAHFGHLSFSFLGLDASPLIFGKMDVVCGAFC